MQKQKWILIILISLILIQTYCISIASSTSTSSGTDDWTMFRQNLSHTGYTTGNSSTNSVKLLWNYSTGAPVWSSPAIASGYVLIGSRDAHIYCLNASNGKPIWDFPTGAEVDSSPAVYNGRVYISSEDGWVYCLDIDTGMPFWISFVGGFVRSSPVVVDGRVYVGSAKHDLLCFNASDGTKIWNFPTLYRVDSSPAVLNGVVYFATDDYHVYAVNASTGKEIWRQHTGSTFSSPCVYDGCIYIGSYDGYICSLNASTGSIIWEYQTEDTVHSSPAVAYGCVYVGSENNNLYCLNASTGKKIWQSATGYWVISSPAVADGNVYVGSEDYSIYCLNASTGAKKWSYATGGYVDSSPAISNGTLCVGSDDSHVYAFALVVSTTEPLRSQYTNAIPLTTIAFDIIVCAALAMIIFGMLRFVRSNRQAKKKTEPLSISSQNQSWLSKHTDAIFIFAILAFSTFFFINLGSGPLWAADEQTYSQWAYHMVKSGDYLAPWAFGSLTVWIGKPPLNMWLMSIAYQLFGVSNFSSRLVSAVFGSLSLVFVFYFAKKLYNRYVGFLSALVLGTFTTFFLFARHAMTDVPFVFFIMASLYFLFLSEKTEKTNQYLALSGVFFGLALITKQVEALLIPLIAITYLVVTKRSIRFLFTRRFALFWGVGLLVLSPWLIYMVVSFSSQFWQWFVVYCGFMRTVSPLEGHGGGYLFYFNYLANNERLWIILLPFATALCAFNAVFKRLKADTLILAWMAIVLLVFTFAQTKLSWYILPAFPAFAIAISSFLYQLLRKIRRLFISKLKYNVGPQDGGPAGI